MQKTADTLEDLENRLDGWLTSIENKITEVNGHSESKSSSEILAKLNETQALIASQVANFESSVREMSHRMKDDANLHRDKIQHVFSEVNNFLFLITTCLEIKKNFH